MVCVISFPLKKIKNSFFFLLGFDEIQWEEIIKSDELETDSSTASEFSNDGIKDKQDVVKLSVSYLYTVLFQ